LEAELMHPCWCWLCINSYMARAPVHSGLPFWPASWNDMWCTV